MGFFRPKMGKIRAKWMVFLVSTALGMRESPWANPSALLRVSLRLKNS
jgi:hypothetical protein